MHVNTVLCLCHICVPHYLGNEVVPTTVHVHGDMPPTSTDNLVLLDIDAHAHRIEPNFRTGPNAVRGVYSIKRVASRNDVLSLANIDRYCLAENDRCLVFLNARRWPGYDTDRKTLEHGDYIRIAVPPSERFVCPTASISEMTQRGLSDQQIIDAIHHDDAASGFSPRLLGDDDIRDLATMPHNDFDEVHIKQLGTIVAETGHDTHAKSESRGSSSEDWWIDLQRLGMV